jgi:hypothetical protein
MPVIVTNQPIMRRLHKAGLLPERCFKVEISEDANGGATIISYYCYMSGEVLEAISKETENG